MAASSVQFPPSQRAQPSQNPKADLIVWRYLNKVVLSVADARIINPDSRVPQGAPAPGRPVNYYEEGGSISVAAPGSSLTVAGGGTAGGSKRTKVDKWFNLETPNLGTFKPALDIFKQISTTFPIEPVDIATNPPPLIVQVLLSIPQPSLNNALVLNHGYNRTRIDPTPCYILLESWRVEITRRTPTSHGNSSDSPFWDVELPTVYKQSIALFRSVYTLLRVLPTWKLYRRLQRKRTGPGSGMTLAMRVEVPSQSASSTASSVVDLPLVVDSTPIIGFDTPLSQHHLANKIESRVFTSIPSPLGELNLSLKYRAETNFRLEPLESLLSAGFALTDGQTDLFAPIELFHVSPNPPPNYPKPPYLPISGAASPPERKEGGGPSRQPLSISGDDDDEFDFGSETSASAHSEPEAYFIIRSDDEPPRNNDFKFEVWFPPRSRAPSEESINSNGNVNQTARPPNFSIDPSPKLAPSSSAFSNVPSSSFGGPSSLAPDHGEDFMNSRRDDSILLGGTSTSPGNGPSFNMSPPSLRLARLRDALSQPGSGDQRRGSEEPPLSPHQLSRDVDGWPWPTTRGNIGPSSSVIGPAMDADPHAYQPSRSGAERGKGRGVVISVLEEAIEQPSVSPRPEGSAAAVSSTMASSVSVEDLGTRITWISPTPVKVNGHFCDVFAGTHSKVGKVALKRPRIGADNEDAIRRFQREAETWERLQHTHILEYLGTFQRDGYFYFVSPFIENGTLIEYLALHLNVNRVKLLCETADAICYLHEKEVVHGDIKASNLLIGNEGQVLLCDFGLTRTTDLRTSTALKGAGTLRWQSPELWNGGSKSFKSDVYAFSMTIVEVLTGDVPFPDLQTDGAVIFAVLIEGRRPPKNPAESSAGLSYEKVWVAAEACWHAIPEKRIPMSEALRLIQQNPALASTQQV